MSFFVPIQVSAAEKKLLKDKRLKAEREMEAAESSLPGGSKVPSLTVKSLSCLGC